MVEAYGCSQARTLAFCHAAPIFSDSEVPERARIAFAFLLSIFLAPLGRATPAPFPIALIVEAAAGLTLGGLVGLLWWTLEATLVPLAQIPEIGELHGLALLSRLAGLTSFLALSGDHHLITLLASPGCSGHAAAALTSSWLDAGQTVFITAAGAIVPLLGALALAQLVSGLVARGATIDMAPIFHPLLAVFVVLLAVGWTAVAGPTFQNALLAGSPSIAGSRDGSSREGGR